MVISRQPSEEGISVRNGSITLTLRMNIEFSNVEIISDTGQFGGKGIKLIWVQERMGSEIKDSKYR